MKHYVYLTLSALCVTAFFTFLDYDKIIQAQTSEYETLKTEAERLYGEGSYSLAHELYAKAEALDLPPAEARWVDFRMADTLWRSQAGTQTSDATLYEQARQQLENLVRDVQWVEDRDRVWAEVQESLGDFWWIRRDSKNWGSAWPYYQQALDWWASAYDLELARQRYFTMVWKMSRPAWVEPFYAYGSYSNLIPLEILENVLKLAQTQDDKAHASYLIAMTLRQRGGDWNHWSRMLEAFETAIKPGKSTEWYDDALYHYAEWVGNYGQAIQLDNGEWRQEPGYVKALELFRRLIREYEKGETSYYDTAKQRIEEITRPIVSVGVSNIFLPDSEIQFYLNWRNVKRVDFTLYPIDLTRDVQFSNKATDGNANWIQHIELAGREKLRTWSKETGDKGEYKPGQDTLRLDGKLPMGAYLLEAKGEGQSARDLILVTDASLVLKTSGKQVLVYFCDVLNGSPISNAQVKLWIGYSGSDKWIWVESTKETNQEGLSVFDLRDHQHSLQIFVSAIAHGRQAFSIGYNNLYSQSLDPWRIYAFTDRPAYRPGEIVQWKLIGRKYNGSVYTTPSGQTLTFEINDPQGSKIKEGKLKLNTFGSAWDSLESKESMPLGEYRVTFWDKDRNQRIGQATLFRLEEYKLPEFKVGVQTAEEDGKKKIFRLGEKVEVTIQADYYFGGPVANATAEVLVYQNPFFPWWQPQREFPWFYEDLSPQSSYYGHGQGQIIKREVLKTDSTGKIALTFETPRNTQQDLEYRIEARVTDASRREIVGQGTVRVTRQRYYIYPRAEHNLYRPQDKVKINIKAVDANDQPVEVEGTIQVTRDYWYEIWLDPDGKEVKGEELKMLREKSRVFPPRTPDQGGTPWRLKFRGYQHDDILKQTVKTNATGEAEFTFTPEREGYYRVAWRSEDKGSRAVQAETTVWVTTSTVTELGYRSGGVEIIVDKDTVRAGQKAPILLTGPTNDRYVLFSVEGEDLYSYQLVHLTGTVKLVELSIEEKHVPNIFLSAFMIQDGQIFMDTKQVIVPPVQHFLKVDVKPDREQYQPQEEGILTVITRDYDDKPISAEVALGLVDESVYYIQQDYAGDPRPFYFGAKRRLHIQTQSTFQQKSYAKLAQGEGDQLIEEQIRDLGKDRRKANLRGEYDEKEDVGFVGQKQESKSLRLSGEMSRVDSPVLEGGSMAARSEIIAQDKIAAPKPASMPEPQQANTEEPAVQVRTDFRASVFWQPDVITDKDGVATVKVKYPDSLTSWRATARVATVGNQFGLAFAGTRTKQPLMVRLQAPRFFVVGDTVTISAVINNNTDEAMVVTTSLDTEGLDVGASPTSTSILANGEARIDWTVAIQRVGQARLKVTARSEKYADAMEKSYPMYEHGIEKFLSRSGKIRGDDATIKLDIPKERKPGSTRLTVQVTPSLAVTMLDALPYLIDYPYGCTEQTMSRFLPAAITLKTLKDLGLQPETVMNKIFGGINQEHVDKTQLKGKKDLRKLDDMIKQGLDRLYDFQHGDGGWGWWKEGDSDHFMTAYVVWGLTLAHDAGIKVKPDVLERAVNYLNQEIVEEEANYDQQAWMLHALSAYKGSMKQSEIGKFQVKAFENLWNNRDRLNAYIRALLALSAHHFGYTDQAKILVQNLENGVKKDTTPDLSIIQTSKQDSSSTVMGTAHWGEDGIYWRWSEGGVEATAFALRTLVAIDPKNPLIELITNWLIKNRRGAQWSNTRDTAITVLALNDYLRYSGELGADVEYELSVNNHPVFTKKLLAEDRIDAPSQFSIDPTYIQDSANEVRIIRKRGNGPIYFAVQAQFFSLEEPVSPAGNEIFVRRQYFRLAGRPTLLKGYIYDRQPLHDGETVNSGERVETVITIEAKNNYEYLVFEDLKPAGLEAVQIRSGEPLYARELKSGTFSKPQISSLKSRDEQTDYTDRTRWVYQELRDRKVALFIDKLPEGFWEIRYSLRAEVPGKFHALPVIGYAMYVPEIRTNGEEIRITVED
jgi:hypothetical protein